MNNKLVVVADLGSIKAYRLEANKPQSTPRLELIEEINLTATQTSLPMMELSGGYRSPMMAKSTASSGERHNIELERKRRLIKQVAQFITALLRRDSSESCYFAASKEISHQVLAELPPESRLKIEKIIACDLIKAEKVDLLRRFDILKSKAGETPFPIPREQMRKFPSSRPQV